MQSSEDDSKTQKSKWYQFCMYLLIPLTFLILFLYYTLPAFNSSPKQIILDGEYQKTMKETDKYLISTSNCKIINWNPMKEDIIKYIYKVPYMPCSSKPLLTYIEYNNSVATLNINQSLLNDYSRFKIYCCYSEVRRIVAEDVADFDLSFSECRPFEEKVVIDIFILKVTCSNFMGLLPLYQNIHFTVGPHLIAKEKIKRKLSVGTVPYNVLFVGIDSMSKSNLVRTMPKAVKFLEQHHFLNLKGYTKIGDNTFPNLMGILTGRTWQQVYEYCNPGVNKSTGCDIIWDRFSKLGYITAYAEDLTSIATFHYERLGFGKAPTDFYFHPYIVASEQLPSKYQDNMRICAGPENSGERILHAAKDFVTKLKGFPKFGFFWMNSYSHNSINLPSAMNDKVAEFLSDIYPHLNNTIFIFCSDHGFRFGEMRHTRTAWLEDRLPFIYVHFPDSFKTKHLNEFKNFVTNSKRLTCPFDIYMTLQDIIHMTDQSYKVRPSQACPKCHSLFEEVDERRTCQDAAIDQHFCLCTGYAPIDANDKIVLEVAEFVVSELNKVIKKSVDGGKCATYLLDDVMFAGISDVYLNDQNKTFEYLFVHFETKPSAKFEATVSVTSQSLSRFQLLGGFSRTDKYADHSHCAHDLLKKLCYCHS